MFYRFPPTTGSHPQRTFVSRRVGLVGVVRDSVVERVKSASFALAKGEIDRW